jgi:hypothetical protein
VRALEPHDARAANDLDALRAMLLREIFRDASNITARNIEL